MIWVNDDGGRSKYFQAENVGDCVVRAIAIATERDYKEIYDELKEINKGKSCRNGTPPKVYKKWFKDHGWKWTPTMKVGKGCSVHMREDELPKGVIVTRLSRHLACVIDGVLFDTYDCSREGTRCVYGYWHR